MLQIIFQKITIEIFICFLTLIVNIVMILLMFFQLKQINSQLEQGKRDSQVRNNEQNERIQQYIQIAHSIKRLVVEMSRITNKISKNMESILRNLKKEEKLELYIEEINIKVNQLYSEFLAYEDNMVYILNGEKFSENQFIIETEIKKLIITITSSFNITEELKNELDLLSNKIDFYYNIYKEENILNCIDAYFSFIRDYKIKNIIL